MYSLCSPAGFYLASERWLQPSISKGVNLWRVAFFEGVKQWTKSMACGCAGGLGGGFELESPEPVMSTRGQDICWHLLLGQGQAAGFRAPARASYQACVKPPGSLVSLKLAPECVEPAWPYAFWSRPSGAAFMKTLWIVNLLRRAWAVFDMASALNTSTTGKKRITRLQCFFFFARYICSDPSQTHDGSHSFCMDLIYKWKKVMLSLICLIHIHLEEVTDAEKKRWGWRSHAFRQSLVYF